MSLQKKLLTKRLSCKISLLLCLLVLGIFSWNGAGWCSSFSEIREAFERDFNRLNPEKIKSRFVSLVESISGMRIDNKIRIDYQPRGDVKDKLFLNEMYRNSLKDNQMIQGYEYILQQFHLLEYNRSLRDILLAYYDDIYGLYDPSNKALVFMEGVNKLAVATVMFHELVHAAQDSTVDLIKYRDQYCGTIDAALAASALIEGQATAVELIVQIERNLEGKTRKEILKYMLEQIGNQTTPIGLNDADMFKALRIFPYSSGLIFVLQRIVKEDSDFLKMFEDVPVSTEQVLHAEKFDTKEQPIITVLEKNRKKISSLPGVNILLDTTLGEYYIRQVFANIFREDISISQKVASGWGGDRIYIIQSGKDLFLIFDTLWDSVEDAKEFFKGYIDFSKKRFNAQRMLTTDNFDATLTKDGNSVLIKKDGNRVIVIEGKIMPSILEGIRKVSAF